MSGVRVNLASGQHQEVVLSCQVADFITRPEEIMVGEADAIQVCRFGFIYEVVDSGKTIVGLRVAVGVEVD